MEKNHEKLTSYLLASVWRNDFNFVYKVKPTPKGVAAVFTDTVS